MNHEDEEMSRRFKGPPPEKHSRDNPHPGFDPGGPKITHEQFLAYEAREARRTHRKRWIMILLSFGALGAIVYLFLK